MPKYNYNPRKEKSWEEEEDFRMSDYLKKAEEIDEEVVSAKRDRAVKNRQMDWLKKTKGESVIPEGPYCYDKSGKCPYWDSFPDHPQQMDGYCWFLLRGDWDEEGHSLLFDQCKECGIKETPDTENDFK